MWLLRRMNTRVPVRVMSTAAAIAKRVVPIHCVKGLKNPRGQGHGGGVEFRVSEATYNPASQPCERITLKANDTRTRNS